MRVLIVAAGSRGDVAPYTGLGARLRQAGHQVTISAHAPFRALVEDAGLLFDELPGDLLAVIAAPAGDRGPSPLFLSRRLSELTRYLHAVGQGALAAAAAADVLLVNATAPFAYHIAEGLGLPSLGVFLQPFEPTAEFPPVLMNAAVPLGRHGNRWAGELLLATLLPFNRVAARLRAQLGLPRLSPRALRRRLAASRWPVFHGYSALVLPRPRDWRPGLEVTGYWWPQDPPGWQPSAELTGFLAAGPAPVLVSFGSMAAGAGRWLGAAVATAVRRAGVRAIVQAGWAELDVERTDDILPVGEVPHSWLMPRTALAVHHAGAGSTAAALRAGTPMVTTPIYADQPLWAQRIAKLGLGPAPVPFRRLTADRLAAAIRQALAEPGYASRARDMAQRINAEDGAAPIVAAVNRLA
jgi:UDP:flavonoid glycosyltransferase YjiC (YdhE family)